MRNLKYILTASLSRLLGRTTLYRLGRWAYATARNDLPGDISENGEKWVQLCVLKACREKNCERVVMFDVGANIGDWLRSLLDVAERLGCLSGLNVHAFEPVPSTYKCLLDMIKDDPRSAVAEIRPECLAMSASRGNAPMFVVAEGAGTNSLHMDSTAVYTQSIVIETNTIDNYLQENNIKMVDLLKCDAEGHDMEVLRGARNALKNELIRVLQFEYNHRWVFSRNYLKDAFDLVADLPYSIGKVTPGSVELLSEWHHELERFFEANFVIVHDDVTHWFLHHKMVFDTSNAIRVE